MMNELITAVEAMNPENLAYAIVTSAAILALIVIGALIRYLMQAIGYSKMYRKAGVAGWKAFIPVYNTYNNYKISWNVKMFVLAIALYILMGASNSTMLALQLAAAAAAIALMVVAFKQNIKMAKLFGKGNGTGITVLLETLIILVSVGVGAAGVTLFNRIKAQKAKAADEATEEDTEETTEEAE